MNFKLLKNIGITLGVVIVLIYVLFLVLPFVLSPIMNKYIPDINKEINKSTGLISDIKDIKILTTPKLTAGIKIGKFVLLTPDNQDVAKADNFEVKMSLLPLLAKNIRVDLVKLKSLDLNLALNKDGSFVIEKYLPKPEEQPIQEENKSTEQLPFGLKLSNHLPDIKLGEYKVNFTDISSGKNYLIEGGKTEITDFILNKSVKISGNGSIILAGREQFKYNAKIYNKIMPDLELQELVFNPQPADDKKGEQVDLNILDVFKGLYNYNITADVDTDITLDKDSYNGHLNLDNMSISPSGIKIPPSNAKLVMKGNKIEINSDLYTAQNEKSVLSGVVSTGKNTDIDINLKSGAELANIVRIVNAVALTFNIKDLQTLSANGKIDADFNIKSNMKKVNSNGYLKIPAAKVRYGLYDITIDNIKADVALDNNNINVKNLGFSIFNQPLKLYGLIKEDATSDLHLIANNLSLKGLIVACGQAALLKDNKINSGLVSLRADVVGKLDKIKPTAKVVLSNVNVKNVPSNIVLSLPNTDVNIVTDGQSFSGNAVSTNIKAINPALTVSVPRLDANIKEDVIEITQTPVKAENIRFNAEGKIKNYLSEKIGLDFITTGDIKSKLTGDMNVVKQTLNLVYATVQDSTIIVPMFDKSRMTFNSHLNITGSMLDPQVSGTVNVPTINIPEVPVVMENITAKLHGSILNGSAAVAKFVSGGIVADTITTDFSMKGENFYLNNMKGNAFDGKFSGNIIYNMSNAKTSIDFKGENMNGEKAIEGAAGIKKALSGVLGFNAKVNLTILPDYNSMMRTLKGNLDFKIDKGAFGTIGRLENFLQANNIVGNTILKTTVGSFSNIASIKNSAEFDYISGDMTFDNGWAKIKNIRSTGKSIAYFVTGKYNLINGSANLSILGRLDGAVVKTLGPIGELSADKLLSYIPKFGALTSKVMSELTANPDKERTGEIPKLSNNNGIHKDFKVEFNGGVESKSSIKSFKWLSKPDLSAIEQTSVKDTVKSFKTNLNTDLNNTVNTIKNIKESVNAQKAAQKEQYKATKQELKDSVDEIKNLFKF